MPNTSQYLKALAHPGVCQYDVAAKSLFLDPQILPRVVQMAVEEYANIPLDVITNYYLPMAAGYWKDEDDHIIRFESYGTEVLSSFRPLTNKAKTPLRKDLRFHLKIPVLSNEGQWEYVQNKSIEFGIELNQHDKTDLIIRSENYFGETVSTHNASDTRSQVDRFVTVWFLMNQDNSSSVHRCIDYKICHNFNNSNMWQPVKESTFHTKVFYLSNIPVTGADVDPNLQIIEVLLSKKLSLKEKEKFMEQHNINLSTKEQENLYRYHLGVQGFCDSYDEGVQDGVSREKHAIALNMYNLGFKTKDIIAATNLPLTEFEKICKENKKDPS